MKYPQRSSRSIRNVCPSPLPPSSGSLRSSAGHCSPDVCKSSPGPSEMHRHTFSTRQRTAEGGAVLPGFTAPLRSPLTGDVQAEVFRDDLSALTSCTLWHPVFSTGNVLSLCRALRVSQPSDANHRDFQQLHFAAWARQFLLSTWLQKPNRCQPQGGGFERLLEDLRSLLLTLSARSVPAHCWLPTKQQMEHQTLQPLSGRCLCRHLRPGQASQGLAHHAHRRWCRISVLLHGGSVPQRPQRASQPRLTQTGPQLRCVVGPARQIRSLAVCCMNEEKGRGARPQTAVLVPHFKDC